MTFLDQLRDWVRRPPPEVRTELPDQLLADARRHLFDLLRRAEQIQTASAVVAEHQAWTAEGALARFLERALVEFEGVSHSPTDLRRLIFACLEQQVLEQTPSGLSTIELLEVRRVARVAMPDLRWNNNDDVAQYAREAGLLRGGAITRAGSVFLDLVGTDAVEWLLNLEVLRSTGLKDPWRAHRSVLEELVANPDEELYWQEAEERADILPPSQVITRLAAMGVIGGVDDAAQRPNVWGWQLRPHGSQILGRVIGDPPSPLGLLAAAACADDLGAVVAPTGPSSSAADATIELSSLVAHELRNAVGPLRAGIRRLFDDDGSLTEDQKARLRARVERGLGRLEAFADQTTQLGRHAVRAGPIRISEAVADALAATAAERNGRLRIEQDLTDAIVTGAHDRFALALANLIRNAAQAAPVEGTLLRIRATRASGGVQLDFEDEGTGVDPSHAHRLFDRGVTLPRADGTRGTGLGLAIVREVIQREMGGSVAYAPREQGGSVFTLFLPIAGDTG